MVNSKQTQLKSLSNHDLVNMLKVKLLCSRLQVISKVFNLSATDLLSVKYLNSISLVYFGKSSVFSFNQQILLLHIYYFVFLLKKQWFNSSVSLARFVTNKKAEYDYRIKPPKMFDYKLFSMSLILGGNKLIKKMKLRADLKVSYFNYNLFLQPAPARKYFYKTIPHYVKTINFFLRKVLFKRFAFTFSKMCLLTNIILPTISSINNLLLLLYRCKRSKFNSWNSNFMKLLAHDYLYSEIPSSYHRVKAICWILNEFIYSERKTGLVAFVSRRAKERARKGAEIKSEYLELDDFEHYYPFSDIERTPDQRRFKGLLPEKYKSLMLEKKKIKNRQLTKFFWLPKKFLKLTIKNKGLLSPGIFLNNDLRYNNKTNRSIKEINSSIYGLFFKSSLTIKNITAIKLLSKKYKQIFVF